MPVKASDSVLQTVNSGLKFVAAIFNFSVVVVSGMGVLQHLHIANSLKYSLILPLPFGVISGAHYTGLNINTAVWCWVNLEFARGIQEKGWVR
jgi:hypothetical protein